MAIIKKFRIKSFKNTTPLLSLEKISLNFGNRKILDNVNFTINSGEIVGMLGPNGVGKSTIFNLITGLIKPDHGKIKFGKEDATETSVSERMKKYSVGYVPQYGGYFHDLTLIENLKAIGQIQIKDPNERHHKINNLIGKFEFESPRKKKTAMQRTTIKPGKRIPKLKYMVGNNEDGSANTVDELTYNEVD